MYEFLRAQRSHILRLLSILLSLFSLQKFLRAQRSYIFGVLSIPGLFRPLKFLRAQRSHIFHVPSIYRGSIAFRCLFVDGDDGTERMPAFPTETSIVGYL